MAAPDKNKKEKKGPGNRTTAADGRKSNYIEGRKKKQIPVMAKNPASPLLIDRVGRPTKLTEDLIRRFAKELRWCFYKETVCDLLGIDRVTMKSWNRRGQAEYNRLKEFPDSDIAAGEELFLQFYHVLKQAVAGALKKNLQYIGKDGSWQSRAWLLERSNPEKWGSQVKEFRDAVRKLEDVTRMMDKMDKTGD